MVSSEGTDTDSTTAEGAIRFRYALSPATSAEVVPEALRLELNAWRHIVCSLGLIGQTPDRYAGYGFGNIGVRDPVGRGFFVTASQTGGEKYLDANKICLVSGWDLADFSVTAHGASPPSSEALTHAMMFDADPRIDWVFHGHSPAIWRAAPQLKLHRIPTTAAYGTQEMAAAVCTLLASTAHRPLVFTTDGHEDGVFAVGSIAAGTALVETLAAALARGFDGSP